MVEGGTNKYNRKKKKGVSKSSILPWFKITTQNLSMMQALLVKKEVKLLS